MAYTVTLIPGDGIGPEVVKATVRILEATGVKFEWESFAAGAEAYEKYHEYIPKELTESIERTHIGLKGPVTTPVGGGFSSINVALRKKFELFANFRPIINLPGVPTKYPDVDLIVVRENTEGLYSGIEHEVVPGVVESLKIITEKASTRISQVRLRVCAQVQAQEDPRHPQSQHHEDVGRIVHPLLAQRLARSYPEITYGEHIVDNTCMQLVMNPYQYDMLLLENLYGDIISDLCAAFVGGLGWCRRELRAWTARSSKPSTARRPTLPAKTWPIRQRCCAQRVLMLHHLGEHDAANHINAALGHVYTEKKHVTRDVGGTAGTVEFADAVIEALRTVPVPAAPSKEAEL